MALRTNARVSYAPRPDSTPEVETAALARAYAYVLGRGADARAEERRDVSKRTATSQTTKGDQPCSD